MKNIKLFEEFSFEIINESIVVPNEYIDSQYA